MVTHQLRLPTPSQFYDALTITLGQFTGCEPGFAIHMERLFFPTLSRFGITREQRDAYQEAGLLYPPDDKAHAPSLWRKYQLAFRYMKDGCVQGEDLPRMYQDSTRYYKLTNFGAQKAAELIPLHDADIMEFFMAPEASTQPRENLTLAWFHENWAKAQPSVRRFMADKLSKSAAMDLTDDHINSFVLRAIRRDSFHDHLKAGNKIYIGTLCHFVARSAYTQLRTWGSDASCRAIRGAYSERDRTRAKKFHEENPEYATARVFSREYAKGAKGSGTCTFEGQEEGYHGAMLDSVGGDLEAEINRRIDMAKTMDEISAVIDSQFPESPRTHFEVFLMKDVEGRTYREIAEAQKIDESTCTSMVRLVRKTLKEAAQAGHLSLPSN